MKQHNIFEYIGNEGENAVHWKLFVDGAARNNPGPAGVGFYLLRDYEFFLQKGFFIGVATNNQAEYMALLVGLFYLKKYYRERDQVHVIADSQLLVKQLNGQFKVRHPELQPLHRLALTMLNSVRGVITHVLRSDNPHADQMANQGIDEKTPLTHEFLSLLRSHDITNFH